MARFVYFAAALAISLFSDIASAITARDATDHRRAVALAREGQIDAALALLETVRQRAPGYSPAAHDMVVVLNWGGRHEQALRSFDSAPAPIPTDVIGAAARSARELHQYDRALTLFRDAVAREYHARGGDLTPFVAGEVLVLADANFTDKAINRADADLAKRRRTADVLEAAAYAEQRADRLFDALARTNAVLEIEPTRRESLRRRAFLLSAIGAPERALEQATAQPTLFSATEIRGLEGDAAAAMVRRGPLPTATEAERYVATDQAIARIDALIARWRTEGSAAEADIRRARLDRIIALHERVRMREVLEEYEALAGDALPAYVRKAAAGAHLYLRQPERARDLYRSVLAEAPDDFDATRGLIYALAECDELDAATALVDELDAREGVWLWLRGAAEPEPNPRKLAAETLAANLRLYADRLGDAQMRFEHMTSIAPNNAQLRTGLANTYLARGWPRRASAEIEYGLAHEPDDRDLELSQGRAALQRRDWQAAEAIQAELGRRFPEDGGVARLQREWRVSQMAELRVTAGPVFTSGTGTSVAGGNGYAIQSTLTSPPFDHSWRGFATTRLAHSRVNEGVVRLRQVGAGLEWRRMEFDANLQASLADYGPTRSGLRAAAGWSPSDEWSFAGFGEIFATETPLRALKNGITANAIGASATWRRDESLNLRGGVQALDFSDGNLRLDANMRAQFRLYDEPQLTIDGAMTFGLTSNSDPGGPYFAPRRGVAVGPEIAVQHILQRRYEAVWSHRLVVVPGMFWQQDFGASFVPELRYEHRIRTSDTLEIGIIASVARPVYDGLPERVFAVTLDLTWKF